MFSTFIKVSRIRIPAVVIVVYVFLSVQTSPALLGQGLAPVTPAKEYIRFGGSVVAIENACSSTVNSSSQSFAASGGAGSFAVSVASGCAWVAQSSVPWISIVSGSSGSGNGTTGFQVSANSSTVDRTASLVVAGQNLTISQAAASPAVPLSTRITPAGLAAAGYSLVFADEFDTLSLSPNGSGSYNWYPGLWYYDTPPPAGQFAVSNSIINIKWSASTGQTETQMSTLRNDGVTGRIFHYGYFEARMKWDVTKGAWPVFWLDSGLAGATTSTSIDIFQGQGDSPTWYNATVSAYTGSTQTFRSSPNSVNLQPVDFSQYHTYGALWTTGQVTWYFDGNPVLSTSVPANSDAQSYYLVLGMLEGVDWTPGDTTGVTVSNLNLNVDYVHVWQTSQ